MSDLESLSVELAKATETRDTFTGKLPGKEAALLAASDHRQDLVRQSIRGVDLSAKVLKDAGLALAAGEDALSLLKEQIAAADAVYTFAKTTHDEAVQAGKLHVVALAQRAVIASGDRLAHHGEALAVAGAQHATNYEALFAAMGEARRQPQDIEIQARQSLKVRIPGAVPADFQNRIIAGGSARTVDVGQFERSTWLHGAALDPEAYAPHNEKVRLLAEQITAQQAFVAAGHAQAAKAAHRGIQAWMPTNSIIR
jgi:hypothetical protein